MSFTPICIDFVFEDLWWGLQARQQIDQIRLKHGRSQWPWNMEFLKSFHNAITANQCNREFKTQILATTALSKKQTLNPTLPSVVSPFLFGPHDHASTGGEFTGTQGPTNDDRAQLFPH